MDGFLKQAMKFGEEQLSKQSGNQNQGQNQYSQNENQGGYGGQQQHHNQQQQQYPSDNDDNYGQQSGGQSYGGNQGGGGADYSQSNQGNYGGNSGGQNNYGNNQSGGDFGVTGGAQFNRPHGQGGAGGPQGGLGIDPSAALDAAGANGKHQADSGLFSSALGMLQGMGNNPSAAQADDLDEDDVQRKHEQAYGQGNAGGMSANAMGAAAAMQAMKKFTSGSGGQSAQSGGNMQSNMIGMAMKEAAKLFDQSGGAASGTKQDAVSGAGATIMKLLLKQQMGGMMGGGNSGGLSQLMGMASKFM